MHIELHHHILVYATYNYAVGRIPQVNGTLKNGMMGRPPQRYKRRVSACLLQAERVVSKIGRGGMLLYARDNFLLVVCAAFFGQV
jgi:hypothetical protein